jgi:hypothetical protein
MPADGSYKISVAARLAGIPVKTLTRDLDREVVKLPGYDKRKNGKGRPRLAKLPTIYCIAIGHALTKVFIPPTTAMSLAERFLEPQRGRDLGHPFESGKTLMLISDGVGKIINRQPDEDISSYLQGTTIVVDLGRIVSTVNSRILPK